MERVVIGVDPHKLSATVDHAVGKGTVPNWLVPPLCSEAGIPCIRCTHGTRREPGAGSAETSCGLRNEKDRIEVCGRARVEIRGAGTFSRSGECCSLCFHCAPRGRPYPALFPAVLSYGSSGGRGSEERSRADPCTATLGGLCALWRVRFFRRKSANSPQQVRQLSIQRNSANAANIAFLQVTALPT